MQKPGKKLGVTITEAHRYKIAFDTVLEFLHQYPDEAFTNPEKPNWSVKDFSLEQFQWWLGKRIDDTDCDYKKNI